LAGESGFKKIERKIKGWDPKIITEGEAKNELGQQGTSMAKVRVKQE